MDKGSLDSIYKASGPIEIDILGKITFAVVAGLTYLVRRQSDRSTDFDSTHPTASSTAT